MEKQGNSKKFLILALLIFIISVFSLYQLFLKKEAGSIYEGTIITLNKNNDFTSILVDGSFSNSISEAPSETVVSYTIKNDMEILVNESLGTADDLAVGNFIKIEGPDSLRTSYPAQGDADKVTLLAEISPEILIRGEIIEMSIGDNPTVISFLVKGEVSGYGNDSEVYVRVPDSAYYPQGPDSIFVPGTQVFVVIDGALAESYPMQGTASSVVPIE